MEATGTEYPIIMMDAGTPEKDGIVVYKESIFSPGKGTDSERAFCSINDSSALQKSSLSGI